MNRIKLGGILVFTFLLVCTAFGSPRHVKSLDQRIKNVENGLVNYTFDENFRMSQLVDSKRIESLPKFNLMESMQNFNIPGVSIAVIDDFKIAWTKTYGVMEAGTNKEITEESLFRSGAWSFPV